MLTIFGMEFGSLLTPLNKGKKATNHLNLNKIGRRDTPHGARNGFLVMFQVDF